MAATRKTFLRPLLYLVGAVLLWGTSYAATKSAYSAVPPMYVVWWRMIIALVVFLPLLRLVKRPDYQPGDWKLLLLAMLFMPCMYFGFEGFAISFTSSSQAGVVTAVMPLVVAVTAWVVLRERPTRRIMTAALISVVGVAVLSLSGGVEADATNPLLGNLLEMGAMLAAAGSTLIVKRLSTRYAPLFLTGLQMAAGSVFFAPLALASGPIDVTAVPVSAWLAIAYLGVGCGLAAFGLYNSALRLMPASRAAVAVNVVPVVALATGWLALGETMSPLQIGACILILGSVVFAQFRVKNAATGEHKAERPEDEQQELAVVAGAKSQASRDFSE
ncbi:MAG: DMT family transporter [Propionibacteriaceae bacterium]|nr:DMT family transporter [Propionibacteriaceae bacterium]